LAPPDAELVPAFLVIGLVNTTGSFAAGAEEAGREVAVGDTATGGATLGGSPCDGAVANGSRDSFISNAGAAVGAEYVILGGAGGAVDEIAGG